MATGPIETKVKAGSAASYLAGVGLLEALQAVEDQPSVIGFLPDWLEPLILALVVPAVTFTAAWKARHTPRTDPDAARAADLRARG